MSTSDLEPFRDIAWPIKGIDFDLAKIKTEVSRLIMMGYPEQRGFCVTNHRAVELENWLHYNGAGVVDWTDSQGQTVDPTTFYQEGWVWKPVTGWHDNRRHRDQDLVDWHPNIDTPELKRLTEQLEQRYGQRMRCRMSTMKGPYNLGVHCDPHTPWRIHLTLLSGPKTRWLFDNQYPWYQPRGSLWMVRTGNITHTVKLGPGETRVQVLWHLWNSDLGPDYYQYPK